jgi:hypothetical protein
MADPLVELVMKGIGSPQRSGQNTLAGNSD